MPLHVEKLSTEIGFREADAPLSEPQMEALITRVVERLEQRLRAAKDVESSTRLRRQATPPLEVGS
jgi:hypothetical protein